MWRRAARPRQATPRRPSPPMAPHPGPLPRRQPQQQTQRRRQRCEQPQRLPRRRPAGQAGQGGSRRWQLWTGPSCCCCRQQCPLSRPPPTGAGGSCSPWAAPQSSSAASILACWAGCRCWWPLRWAARWQGWQRWARQVWRARPRSGGWGRATPSELRWWQCMDSVWRPCGLTRLRRVRVASGGLVAGPAEQRSLPMWHAARPAILPHYLC